MTLTRLAAAAALALALPLAAHASTEYGDLPEYLAAGNTLTDISGYAPSHHAVAYPGGFTGSTGVSFSGADLEGFGSDAAGVGQPEYINSTGPMTINFAPTDGFAFYLRPGDWDISEPDDGGFVRVISSQPAVFIGFSNATPFDDFVISSNIAGPVEVLTTPPQVPEPSSLSLLGVAALGMLAVGRGRRRENP